MIVLMLEDFDANGEAVEAEVEVRTLCTSDSNRGADVLPAVVTMVLGAARDS